MIHTLLCYSRRFLFAPTLDFLFSLFCVNDTATVVYQRLSANVARTKHEVIVLFLVESFENVQYFPVEGLLTRNVSVITYHCCLALCQW